MKENNPLHKLYEPIGELVVAFSHLEATVLFLIVALIEVEQDPGMALVAEMSFAKRLDALKSIAPYRIKDTAIHDELIE